MATIKQIMAMSADERDAANQAQLSKLTSLPVPATEFHAATLKGWQVKLCGPKPAPEAVKLNYVLDGGRRAGVEVMWLAMTLRANNNAAKYNTERNGAAWFVRIPLPNSERAGRWQHVITDKGIAQLDKRIAALTGATEAKAVKAAKAPKAAKVTRKRNKASPVPAVTDTPTSDAPSVTEATPAEQVTPEALAALAAQFNS